ncbi:MAG: glycosyltransferase family 4 protein [Nitrospinales bacterium]
MLKRPIKLAVVRQRYAPHGGAENFSLEYIRRMADAGHEVHVFSREWAPLTHPNIHVHKVPALRFNATVRFLSFAWSARKLLKRDQFDLIQSHERTLYQDIYRAGDGCHKEWLERRMQYLSPLRNLSIFLNPFHWVVLNIEKYIFAPGHYKKIVAISERVKRDIQKHYKVPGEDIVVIYNGVELERFKPENKAVYRGPVRQTLNVPEDALLILTVGSGFERKGLKFLIQSLSHLKCGDWRLLVIGKGNWRKVQGWAAARQVREKMIHLPLAREIEKYYAAADLFVFPSIYEPFGNANLEALASGLPVVVSKQCGAAEIVAHKRSGMILQDPGNSREIATHINYLLDPAVRETMGREARKCAEGFASEKNTESMLRLYADLLQEQRR